MAKSNNIENDTAGHSSSSHVSNNNKMKKNSAACHKSKKAKLCDEDEKKAKLERTRYIKRMSWKKKQLREKQNLTDLTQAHFKWSKTNLQLTQENRKIRQLMKIMRDPNDGKRRNPIIEKIKMQLHTERTAIFSASMKEAENANYPDISALRNILTNKTGQTDQLQQHASLLQHYSSLAGIPVDDLRSLQSNNSSISASGGIHQNISEENIQNMRNQRVQQIQTEQRIASLSASLQDAEGGAKTPDIHTLRRLLTNNSQTNQLQQYLSLLQPSVGGVPIHELQKLTEQNSSIFPSNSGFRNISNDEIQNFKNQQMLQILSRQMPQINQSNRSIYGSFCSPLAPFNSAIADEAALHNMISSNNHAYYAARNLGQVENAMQGGVDQVQSRELELNLRREISMLQASNLLSNSTSVHHPSSGQYIPSEMELLNSLGKSGTTGTNAAAEVLLNNFRLDRQSLKAVADLIGSLSPPNISQYASAAEHNVRPTSHSNPSLYGRNSAF